MQRASPPVTAPGTLREKRKVKDSHRCTWDVNRLLLRVNNSIFPSSRSASFGSAHSHGHRSEGLCPLGMFALDIAGSAGRTGELYMRLQSQRELARILWRLRARGELVVCHCQQV